MIARTLYAVGGAVAGLLPGAAFLPVVGAVLPAWVWAAAALTVWATLLVLAVVMHLRHERRQRLPR